MLTIKRNCQSMWITLYDFNCYIVDLLRSNILCWGKQRFTKNIGSSFLLFVLAPEGEIGVLNTSRQKCLKSEENSVCESNCQSFSNNWTSVIFFQIRRKLLLFKWLLQSILKLSIWRKWNFIKRKSSLETFDSLALSQKDEFSRWSWATRLLDSAQINMESSHLSYLCHSFCLITFFLTHINDLFYLTL